MDAENCYAKPKVVVGKQTVGKYCPIQFQHSHKLSKTSKNVQFTLFGSLFSKILIYSLFHKYMTQYVPMKSQKQAEGQ